MSMERENTPELDKELFEGMLAAYMEAAGKAISSIVRTDVVISAPKTEQMELKQVEYSILEPALFVKSCLTQKMAGTMLLIFRDRDIQIFLNKLMGVDELAKPDFEFDEISLSAANEIMNQMAKESVGAMADYLDNTMASSNCDLGLSEDGKPLPEFMGEDEDSQVTVVTYKILIDDMIESEFIQVFSVTAVENLQEELEIKAVKMQEQQLEAEAPKAEEDPEDELVLVGGTPKSGEAVAEEWVDPEIQTKPYDSNLGLIMNVPLNVSVEIGKTKRKLKDVLNFNNGTVVELEKQADAPVDIIVNGQLIARGNVVVIDDNFGVRITEIVNKKNIFGNGE